MLELKSPLLSKTDAFFLKFYHFLIAKANEYNYQTLVNPAGSNTPDGGVFISNLDLNSFNHNYPQGVSPNDELNNAYCSNQNRGNCAWTAYCTTPPGNDFFSNGGINNCHIFSTPQQTEYMLEQ